MTGAAVVAGQTAGGIIAGVFSMRNSCCVTWRIVMGHMIRMTDVLLMGWSGMRGARPGHAVLLAKRHGDRAIALHRQPERN